MQDRVGEVLAERAALDSGAAAGLSLSFVLHLAAGAAVVYAAMHQPKMQNANVVDIKWMKMPSVVSAPVVSAPPAPLPQPIAPPQPVPKNTAPPSTFGRSEKKPAEIPTPQPRNPATTTQPSIPSTQTAPPTTQTVPIGGSGVTGLEGGDFPYTIYIDNMKRLIGSHWFRPQITGEVTATVYFVIERDGRIRDAKNEATSGNGTFDRAALRAVLEASPLPPLPFAYSGTYLGVHLTFR